MSSSLIRLNILKNLWLEGLKDTKPYEKVWKDIISIDPTKNKSYLNWIVRRLIKHREATKQSATRMQEDFYKVRDNLKKYHELKIKNRLKLNEKDINRLKSLRDLDNLIDSYTEQLQDTSLDGTKAKEFFDKKEAILHYDDSKYRVVIPKTHLASCFFGSNTKWCTAREDDSANFRDYNKDGNLYIITIKSTGEKYQFHLESAQFMDSKDNEVDFKEFDKKYPEVFGKILKFTEKEQLKAIKQNGIAIRFIKNPSEQVQLAAVQQNGNAIQFIENPSEKVQLAAVEEDSYAINFIKNPPEKLQILAARQDGKSIRFIKNPSEPVQLAAVNKNGYVIEVIQNPSEEIQLAAVKNTWRAIEYVKNPTKKVQLEALKSSGWAIQHIENPSEEFKLLAVTKNGDAIQCILYPSEEIQLAAVKNTWRAIYYIKNPTEKVKQLASSLSSEAAAYIASQTDHTDFIEWHNTRILQA